MVKIILYIIWLAYIYASVTCMRWYCKQHMQNSMKKLVSKDTLVRSLLILITLSFPALNKVSHLPTLQYTLLLVLTRPTWRWAWRAQSYWPAHADAYEVQPNAVPALAAARVQSAPGWHRCSIACTDNPVHADPVVPARQPKLARMWCETDSVAYEHLDEQQSGHTIKEAYLNGAIYI